jgi:hypothetical protein
MPSHDWTKNKDAQGVQTFLLPGETSIDAATMRQRTREYYRQMNSPTPGRLERQAAAKPHLDKLRQMLHGKPPKK